MGRMSPIRSLDDIERMEHVLKYYSIRNWLIFKFGINTALRVGDLLKLKVGTVRKRWLNLKEEKTGKTRRFYINDSLKPILENYTKFMSDDDYLFRSLYHNVPLSTSGAYATLRHAGNILGLENIGTHSMRKTFAYHFYKKGKDIGKLMVILNHSSERETLIYIDVVQEEIDEAVKDFFL